MKTNFEKYSDSKNFVIYDYNSVMHYSQFAFSKKYYLPSIKVSICVGIIKLRNIKLLLIFLILVFVH